MANGDVHDQVSDQYLKQFDRSVGVSGMQKLQSFPELQKLGHAGTLSHQKRDFHGLQDFKSQMAKYSHVSHTLRIAWALISSIVPNNPSIQKQLFSAPGLGSVGEAFKSIHGFGQVFSLTPKDLKSPAAVQSKASVYKNQSVQASVVTDYSTQEAIGGGASPTSPGNASSLNGFLIVGTPTEVNNSLSFDHLTGNLVWGPGGSGGGGGSSTLAADTDVLLTSPSDGQFLVYSNGAGKWENHSLIASDIPSLPESKITGLVSDLSTLTSAISSEASTRASADFSEASTRASADTAEASARAAADSSEATTRAAADSSEATTRAAADTVLTSAITAETARATAAEALAELLSHKDAASGYAGLTAGSLLKTAEFPAFTGDVTTSSGAVATTVAKLQGTTLTVTSLASGQFLEYNGSAWVNHSLVAGDIPNIAESQVTNLVSDLALKAPLASPALTGVPTAPTAAAGTSTTQIATTGFVTSALATPVAAGSDTQIQFNDGGFVAGNAALLFNKLTGLTSIKNLNSTRYASQFTGADMGAKIAAAAADLTSLGGTIDARDFSSSETWSTDVLGGFGKPIVLLLGPGNITLTHSQTVSADISILGAINETNFETAITTGSLFTCPYPYVTFLRGCNFTQTAGSGGTLFNFTGAQFCRLEEIAFINGSWDVAILLDNDTTSSCIYNSFADIFIFGPTTCIKLKSSQASKTTNANRFENIICQATSGGTGVAFDSGALGTIGENVFVNGDWSGAAKGVDIACSTGRNNVFQAVTIENNTTSGISIASGSFNNQFYGCTVTGNGTNVSDAGSTNVFVSNIGGTTPVFALDSSGVLSAAGLNIGNTKLQLDTGRFGSNAVRFQATGLNQEGALTIMPSGSSTDTEFRLYNTSDPSNTGSIGLALSGTTLTLFPFQWGTGVAPTVFDMSAVSVKSGTLDMTSHKINNVTDPTSAQDAATKSYVDASFTTGSMVMSINSQTGTSYTVLNGDRAKLLTFSNASAVAVTLPQAGVGGSFNNTWFAYFQNVGNGPVTITPTTSTISGETSIVLFKGQGVLIASDGTNYSLNSGRPSRSSTYSVTTASLAAAAIENDSITMPKAGLLYTVDVTSAKKCRIRLYSTSAARTADASRSYQVPPTPGTQHGVLADFYFDQTSSVTPWMCSPGVILFNNDSTPLRTIYVAITNIDTSTQAITATFSVVPLES